MATMVSVRRVGLMAAALASVFLLSGCNPSSSPAENFPGVPVAAEAAPIDVDPGAGGSPGDAAEETTHGEAFNEDGKPNVVWWEEGAQLAFVVWGSSSCPIVGEKISVIHPAGEGNRVAIDVVKRDENEACTMDLVPHTTVFWTPTDVTTTEPLTVEVLGTEVEVPIK